MAERAFLTFLVSVLATACAGSARRLLVAELLSSPAFRSRVGRISAAESADRFVTNAIDQERLARVCEPWRDHNWSD